MFAKCGKKVLSCSADKLIKIWDVDSGKCDRTFEGHTKKV